MEVLALLAAATATMLATGLGAIPVYALGVRAERLGPLLLGVTAGVMGAASVGLLIPAVRDGSPGEVALGLALGAAALVAGDRLLSRRQRRQVLTAERRRALLVFGALLVHSLPEGLAIGCAWASEEEGIAAFVVIAIAIQNIPEGTATAVPMRDAGDGFGRAFGAAVLTSAPQPVGALLAYLAVEQAQSLLPGSLAFAAGAMLALIVRDLLPDALGEGPRGALIGVAAGAGGMALLGVALGAA